MQEEEEESVAKLTDNASTLEEVAKTKVQNTIQTPQNDPALEAFDRLRSKRVEAEFFCPASAFLAKFQSIAASLQPDERIKLVVYAYENSMELLKTVLSDPQANKICSLCWDYFDKEDVNSIIPLLINNCPELASLYVYSKHHSASDFVSSMLEHSNNKIKVLSLPRYTTGNISRFFAALGQSQALDLSIGDSPEFAQGLFEYLAKDLLVRLYVRMDNKQVPSEMVVSLANCTRLAELKLAECKFSQPTAFTHLPKFVTKLVLRDCQFIGGVDWSFLTDSNVRELHFHCMRGVDGNQLGDALAVHLREKGLDRLYFSAVGFVNETLAVIGVELGRIKRLEIASHLNDASIKLIALALECPNNELRELVLWHKNNMASDIKNHFVPALKHPNCNLAKLSLSTYGAKVEEDFHNRLALFVLLRGQQARRRYCPLRRLPVEMLRLVGMALI